MARSNGFPFQLIDAAPFQDVGWEVRVIHRKDFYKLCDPLIRWINPPLDPDTGTLPVIRPPEYLNSARPIAVISRFQNLTLSTEINGVGSGSITLDLDDEFWAGTLTNGEPAVTLLEYEHLWQVYENGALRGAFLGQVVQETYLPAGDGARALQISGPGPADALRWGVVMTPWYPNPAPPSTVLGQPVESPYNFKRITHMGAWKILLADAKKRGTLGFVCPNFDKDVDSGGTPWPDQPAPIPDPNIVTSILSGDINFFVDSATLTEAARDKLNGFTGSFSGMKAPHVTVVGHTDSTNTMSYNQTLSVNRAWAAANFLKSKVPQVVLSVSGKGETQPIATNQTVRGREKNRRVVVTYPVGPPYTPETYFAPELGRNLLEVLEEWIGHNIDEASPLRAEYIMQPNFRLDVRVEFGTRRDSEVIFFEGSTTTISKDRERRRANVRNLIAAQGSDGTYTILVDELSKTRFDQRETYVSVAATFNATARNDIAAGTLAQNQTEETTWTITLPPFEKGRRVYEDYTLGDWIGISRYLGAATNVVEPFRVLAITCNIDANGETKLELMLQSKDESYLQKLKGRMANFIGKVGTKVFIQDEEPPNAKIGDLWTPLTTGLYG